MAGIIKRLESFSKKKKSVEESPFVVRNGGVLMEKLLSLSNGREEIHIKRFTNQQITYSTNNFEEVAMYRLDQGLCKGNLDGRPILVLRKWYNDSVMFGIAISALMSHLKNVLKLIGCSLDCESPALVYEYTGSTTLSDFLHNYVDVSLSWGNRIKIAKDIAGMLIYLHTCFPMTIVHRNLHPDNVFIDENGVAKLFNFSFAIPIPRGESEVQVEDTTWGAYRVKDPGYSATGVVTTKIDVYSFGVILILLLTGKHDFLDTVGHDIGLIGFVEKFTSSEAQMDTFVDPRIIENVKVPEFEAILDIAIRCLRIRGDNPPEMIQVARLLHQIYKDTTR